MQNAQNQQRTYEPVELDETFPCEAILGIKNSGSVIHDLHRHDVLELGYCHEGAGTLHMEGELFPYRAGTMTAIPSQQHHRSQSLRGVDSVWSWVFLSPERLLVPRVCSVLPSFGIPQHNTIQRDEHPELVDILCEILDEVRQEGVGWQANVRALALVLLNRLARLWPQSPSDDSANDLTRLAPALDMIGGRYDESLSVDELAAACHMSLRNFQLVFTQTLGISPKEYITRCRINIASALLQSTREQIGEIAFKCGYASISSFNRAFRKIHRETPRAYRKAAGKRRESAGRT